LLNNAVKYSDRTKHIVSKVDGAPAAGGDLVAQTVDH
jgi:hypothetical protein